MLLRLNTGNEYFFNKRGFPQAVITCDEIIRIKAEVNRFR